jgi:hypothetical protein
MNAFRGLSVTHRQVSGCRSRIAGLDCYGCGFGRDSGVVRTIISHHQSAGGDGNLPTNFEYCERHFLKSAVAVKAKSCIARS